MLLSQIYPLVLEYKQHGGTCQIRSDQWQLVPPRTQSGLHRDAIGHLQLPVRLHYGNGCVDHLSSGLRKTEFSSFIILEALKHKHLYSSPKLLRILRHLMRLRRWRLVGRHNFVDVGGFFGRTVVKYCDRGVRYVYIAAAQPACLIFGAPK